MQEGLRGLERDGKKLLENKKSYMKNHSSFLPLTQMAKENDFVFSPAN